MGIRFTGSQGQYERIRRRQSLQQGENQVERESPERLYGLERKQSRWYRFGVWLAHPRARSIREVRYSFGVGLRNWSREVWGGVKIIVQWAVGLFVVGFIVALVVNGYQSLDSSGWISHDHDTPVWIQGDWMLGEYRTCQMRTMLLAGDSMTNLPRLFCGQDANGIFDLQVEVGDIPPSYSPPAQGAMYPFTLNATAIDGDFHTMPVRYWGRIDRKDKWVISWRCQRLSESLECKALD